MSVVIDVFLVTVVDISDNNYVKKSCKKKSTAEFFRNDLSFKQKYLIKIVDFFILFLFPKQLSANRCFILSGPVPIYTYI